MSESDTSRPYRFGYFASEESEDVSQVVGLTVVSIALECMVMVVLNEYAKRKYDVSLFGVGKHAMQNDRRPRRPHTHVVARAPTSPALTQAQRRKAILFCAFV